MPSSPPQCLGRLTKQRLSRVVDILSEACAHFIEGIAVPSAEVDRFDGPNLEDISLPLSPHSSTPAEAAAAARLSRNNAAGGNGSNMSFATVSGPSFRAPSSSSASVAAESAVHDSVYNKSGSVVFGGGGFGSGGATTGSQGGEVVVAKSPSMTRGDAEEEEEEERRFDEMTNVKIALESVGGERKSIRLRSLTVFLTLFIWVAISHLRCPVPLIFPPSCWPARSSSGGKDVNNHPEDPLGPHPGPTEYRSILHTLLLPKLHFDSHYLSVPISHRCDLCPRRQATRHLLPQVPRHREEHPGHSPRRRLQEAVPQAGRKQELGKVEHGAAPGGGRREEVTFLSKKNRGADSVKS